MKILERVWSFLPDTCEVHDCCRKGVRGNENRVYPFPDISDFYIVMCDYCNSRYMAGEVMKVNGITSRMIVSKGSPVIDFKTRRRKREIDKSTTG